MAFSRFQRGERAAAVALLTLVVLLASVPCVSADVSEAYKPIRDAIVRISAESTPRPADRVAIIRSTLATLRLSEMTKSVPGLDADVDVAEFVDRTVACSGRNTLLTTFIASVAYLKWPFFDNQVDKASVVPRSVMLAVVLERLTSAARSNPAIYAEIDARLALARDAVPWRKHMNTFEVAKLLSVSYGVSKIIEAVSTGVVPAARGRRVVPLNIVEACLEDSRLGLRDNAEAGLAIAFEAPGAAEHNPLTGEGPSTLGPDGKSIEYRFPLGELWVDLYQTWDMAFVAHYDEAPLLWTKLFIPQVSCYHDYPEVYMYNRAISLHMVTHYLAFSRLDRDTDEPVMKWHSPDLVRMWGEHNLAVAKEYEEELVQVRAHTQGWFEAQAKSFLKKVTSTSGSKLKDFADFVAAVQSEEDVDTCSSNVLVRLARKAGGAVSMIMDAISWIWGNAEKAGLEVV